MTLLIVAVAVAGLATSAVLFQLVRMHRETQAKAWVAGGVVLNYLALVAMVVLECLRLTPNRRGTA